MSMTITLCHAGNPDIGGGYWEPPVDSGRSHRVPVESVDDAARVFRAWIDRNGLGAGNLGKGAGDVRQGRRIIATVSYNGRVWNPGPWPRTPYGEAVSA